MQQCSILISVMSLNIKIANFVKWAVLWFGCNIYISLKFHLKQNGWSNQKSVNVLAVVNDVCLFVTVVKGNYIVS